MEQPKVFASFQEFVTACNWNFLTVRSLSRSDSCSSNAFDEDSNPGPLLPGAAGSGSGGLRIRSAPAANRWAFQTARPPTPPSIVRSVDRHFYCHGSATRRIWRRGFDHSGSSLEVGSSSPGRHSAPGDRHRPHRYERVANPKPIHESRDPTTKSRAATAAVATSAAGGRSSRRRAERAAAAAAAASATAAESAESPEAASAAEEKLQPQPQPQQTAADFRQMLREIGQRKPRPQTAAVDGAAGGDYAFTSTAPPASSLAVKETAGKPQVDAQWQQQQQQQQPYHNHQQRWVAPRSEYSIAGSLGERWHNNFQSSLREPETAVAYCTERDRRQQRQEQKPDKSCTSGSGRAPGEGPLLSLLQQSQSHSDNSREQQQQQQAAAVFQPAAGHNHHQSTPEFASGAAVRTDRRPIERKPVTYGYDWLQEFNKMSMTEAEIERRVKNGGKLRNTTCQTTRFELPIDLRELEGMDPKDYLRQYTVVSSRRMYLYQKVFQKYRNPSLSAVEIKDLPKCITDIIVGGISEEKLEEVMELTGMKDAGQLDSKLFYAFCAVVERQTTGKKQLDDQSEVMESHKQRLECADFIGLNYKFKGVNLSERMGRLLRAL